MKRLLVALLLLTACQEEVAQRPDPVPLTREARSHYCLMQLADHGGPKAQIHLEGFLDPLFFAQVRDGLAYLRGPERTAPILAVYVSDMGRAASWEEPGAENWVPIEEALFVVGANVTGGMGAPEIAPFADRTAAAAFVAARGGEVMALAEIPDERLFGPVEIDIERRE